MPIYKYECKNCNKEFEELISYKESNKVKCPNCNKIAEKLPSYFHMSWESKMYKTFVGAEDERAEAESKSHMGKEPYNIFNDESM